MHFASLFFLESIPCFLSQLLHAPLGSRLARTDFDGTTLTLGIETTNPNASCTALRPGELAGSIAATLGLLAEEPAFGHPVRLQMTVRRFLCPEPECPRRIFAEPLDGFAAKQARTTTRLAQTHLAIGSALGGEAGARLAEQTGDADQPRHVTASRQAGRRLARRVIRNFVGIDDWAWCKGQRYGTIVVDLQTNEVIDLLPDRDAVDRQAPGWRISSRRRTGQPRPRLGLLPGGHRVRVHLRRSRSPIDGIS